MSFRYIEFFLKYFPNNHFAYQTIQDFLRSNLVPDCTLDAISELLSSIFGSNFREQVDLAFAVIFIICRTVPAKFI